MFYIIYEVIGFPGEHKAGPYSAKESQYQKCDIAGYEGVINARIVPAEEVEVKKEQK